MKKIQKLTIALSVIALLFASCSENEGPGADVTALEKSRNMNALNTDSCTYGIPLNEAEIEGLLFMREEEKLAFDLYTAFYEQHGDALFGRIARSENNHMQALKRMLVGHNIDDPASENAGEFINVKLTTLYTDWLAKGKAEVAEALEIGATIEEVDILDLLKELENIENEELIKVYNNLLNGSESHLRAFVKALETAGFNYKPQFLQEKMFEEIINTTNGKQNKRQGNGSCDGTQNGTGQQNQSKQKGQGNGQGQNGTGGNGQGQQGNGSNGNGNGK